MNIAVIGGGITGLVTAWHLQRRGATAHVYEAGEVGGNMRSRHLPGGYVVELGPNSLQLSPELAELLKGLGLEDQIQEPEAVSSRRYVVRDGRVRELPAKPQQLLLSGFFSLGAKLNVLRELRRPAQPADPQETIAHFFRRRFGQEIVDYAVNPFVSGIYAGDPTRLLVHQTFPQLPALEQQHGSVLRGFAKTMKGAARRRIISLRGGLQALTDALVQQLRHVHPRTRVEALLPQPDGRFRLRLAGQPALAEIFDAVVLALPAYAAAPLLAPLDADAGEALAAVHYPPMTAVHTAYLRADVQHPLNGFGALSPKAEQPVAAGTLWSSSLFPDRAPAGQVLLTSFVGGAQYEALAQLPDEQLLAAVRAEHERLYGLRPGAPAQLQHIFRWPRSIPQFDSGILPAHAAADRLAARGIWTVANWRAGVGIPDCLRRAEQVATALTPA
ncbi:protoporphyrinogen oxidase [Hymenobacter sp. 15J16-1T3B]|uniref:protoporphyrinogen oxidase n=1 Tax=Hymenobacter sp. 15J16-1T3B TaxID=2886941 RepID=UPI001D118B00|nr:protoporphyrinogen oxidase [Hymenobacter sp. 15J16-1T3B]MCC3160488.1 protoporphyrinogen oxidase [Hymenobacter sp. 15J16-1T3B]